MNNLGILYFSSTGNSLYIAKRIQQKLGGKVLYAPSYTADGSEFDGVIIVTPIYSFGMPVPILKLFDQLKDGLEIIAIQNYGGMVGGADRLLCQYAKNSRLTVKSVYTLKMPENFTLVMSPPKFYLRSILNSANKRIDAVINEIESGKCRLPNKKRTKEQTYLKNKENWHLIGERFSVTDKCVRCGKCIKICPAHNIRLENGQITFGGNCIACIGCFHRCPQKAIIYQGKDNKKRYVNPNVDDNEIGKNFE
ncbi:MAG: EFR1 family ferrodoxin [Corallococcus sp.]|nr:EFR1 family ferrodoxin [Corallococcus sp.]